MASSERLMRAEEDITAIGYTVLDIKATVEGHTATLACHTDILSGHTATLASHTDILSGHTDTLASHTDILSGHTDTLSAHGRDLADIKGALATIMSTLDEILTAIRPAK